MDFNPYGLNALVAWIALELAVAALFVRPANRVTALSAMLVLSIVAEVVTTGLSLGVPAVTPAIEQSPLWTGPIAAYLIYALAVVWWVGAMATVVGSLEPQLRLRLIGKAAALWVALFVANALVPQAPVFLPPDFDARNANWWEFLYALHHDKNGEARVTRFRDRPPRKGATCAAQSRTRRSGAAAPRRDRHLRAGRRRLGRSRCLRQGARRRPAGNRQRVADQSNAPFA